MSGKEERMAEDVEAPVETESDALSDDEWLTQQQSGSEPEEPEPEAPVEAKTEPEKPEGEPEKLETEDEKAKRRGNPRYDARARMLEATREAAALKRRVAELEQRLNGSAKKTTAAPGDDDTPPDPTSYPNTDEGALKLVEDRAAWASRQEYKRLRAEEYKRRADEERENSQRETSERVTSYWNKVLGDFEGVKQAEMARDPRFLEGLSTEVAGLVPSYIVQLEGQDVGPTNVVADEIIRSGQQAPALMRHFSEHPDDLQRIAALEAPRDIVREVAIIGARLDAATAPAKRASQPSKAPPPIKPVQGSPSAADPNEVSDDMDDDEYLSRRMRQIWKSERRTG